MDKKLAGVIGDEIAEAIAGVLDRHNMTLEGRRGSYTDTTFDLKLALVDKPDPALGYNPNTREAQAYVQAAAIFDLPALGTVVTLGREDFRIVGWNNRAQKMPIELVAVVGGRGAKTSEDNVRRAVAARQAS